MSSKRYLRQTISKSEMERRYKAIREMMRKKDLDLLLIQQPFGSYWGGAVRYLTSTMSGLEGTNLIFPIDGEITMISHRDAPSQAERELYGIQDWRGVGMNSQFNFAEDAKLTANILKERRPSAIGLVGLPLMQATFYDRLLRELPRNIWVEDVTLAFDEIRWVKSEEEIRMCEQAAAMNDVGIEACEKALRAGKKENEVAAQVIRAVWEAGSDGQLIGFGTAPPGETCTMRMPPTWVRTIKDRDIAVCMVECSGIGGYFTETARMLCMGRIPKDLREAFDVAKEMQSEAAKMIGPGTSMPDVVDRMNEVAGESRSYTGMGYGHGQGLDVMEKPVLLPDEYVKAQKGMNLAIHPSVMMGKTYAFICDNYEVTETGTRRLHKNPQEIHPV